MVETEVKFKVRAFGAIRKRLKSLGSRLIWEGVEKSFFFDTPDKTLHRQNKNLRLRSWSGHSNTITLKFPTKARSSRYKVREELQIVVDDIEEARHILIILGFSNEYLRYEKKREHWKLGKASIELDEIKGVKFIEIEASRSGIEKLARLLGLDWSQSTTQSYLAILRELKARK